MHLPRLGTGESPRPVGRALAVGAVALAAAATLTACGGGGSGGGGKDHDVASIDRPSGGSGRGGAKGSGGAGGSGADSADEKDRPQLRLDSSDEERDGYWHTYNLCLKDNGVRQYPGRGLSPDQDDNSPAAQQARRTCLPKLPLQPPELDRDRNPHYADDYRDYVRCLNKGGLKVKALPDASGWNYVGTPHLSQAAQTKLDHTCTMESFGGKQ